MVDRVDRNLPDPESAPPLDPVEGAPLPREALESYAAPPPPPGLPARVLAVAAARRRARLGAALLATAVAAAAGWMLWPRRAHQGGELEAAAAPAHVRLGARASADAEAGAALRWSVHGGEVVVEQTSGRVTYRTAADGRLQVRTAAATARAGGASRVPAADATIATGATGGTTFDVEVSMPGSSKRIVVVGAVGVAAVVAVYQGRVWLRNDHGEVALAAGQRGRASAQSAPEALGAPVAAAPSQPAAPAVARGAGAGHGVRRFESVAARQRLVAAIGAARTKREQAAAARPQPAPPAEVVDDHGDMDKEVIRSTVREIVPLLGECYQQVLDENPEGHDLPQGSIVVHFTISGEPEVGGLVEAADIPEGGELNDPAMRECVIQTILSLEFPPPESGGTVEVNYPFMFAPE